MKAFHQFQSNFLTCYYLNFVIMTMSDSELSLRNIQQTGGSEHLTLLRDQAAAVLLETRILVKQIESAQTGSILLQTHPLDCQHHLK